MIDHVPRNIGSASAHNGDVDARSQSQFAPVPTAHAPGPLYEYRGTFEAALAEDSTKRSASIPGRAAPQRRLAWRSCKPPAPQPSRYIRAGHAQEAELAQKIWTLAARMEADERFREFAFEEFNRGVEITALGSILMDHHPLRMLTPPKGQLRLAVSIAHHFSRRDTTEKHRQALMQNFLGTVYPDVVRSNAAHVFEAMGLLPFLTEIPLVGNDIARLASFVLSMGWDLGFSPAVKVFFSAIKPYEAWKYDADQFADFDAAGITFGYDWLRWSKDESCDR